MGRFKRTRRCPPPIHDTEYNRWWREIGWRTKIAHYHAGEAIQPRESDLVAEILATGNLWFDNVPRAKIDQIVRRLRKAGLIRYARRKSSPRRGWNKVIFVGPHVPARPVAKSQRREKHGRRV